MSRDLTIAPGETGDVRVFALNLTPQEVRALEEPGAVAALLGLEALQPGWAQVVAVADLKGVGLPGYLAEGWGVPEARLAPDRARLDALEGHVLILPSRAVAVEDRPATLTLGAELTFIGHYTEAEPAPAGPPVEAESAQPYTGAPRAAPRAQRAAARRAGAALFMAMILVFLFIIYLVVS